MKIAGPYNLMNRLMPRAIDWIAFVLYLGCLTVYTVLAWRGEFPVVYPALTVGLVLLGLGLLITLDRIEYWRFGEHPSPRVFGIFLLLRLAIIIGIGYSDGLGFRPWESFIVLAILFTMFFFIGETYGLSGQAWTMYLLSRLRAGSDGPPEDQGTLVFLIILSIMLTFIFSIAYLVRRERYARRESERLLAELETSHRRLQDYAEKVAELATTEERNRLAREIHDSLGHYLTVINVQLEKALAFRERVPAEADRAVQDAKRLASEALTDIRRSVSTLRQSPEPFSLTQSLRTLVGNMNSFTITLDIQGDEAGYSDQSLRTLYRAAQEGLTNIQKHAQASQASLHIRLEPQAATLCIEDNGRGFDPQILEQRRNGAHYGLRGVKERLELIHGSFKLDSVPNGGTTLSITVPKDPLALQHEG